MKRKKRKQLKEDEFITTINKIMRFIQERGKELSALLVLVLFVVLIIAGTRIFKSQQSKKESRLVTEIFSLGSELNSNPESLKKLEELAGKGRFSRLAYVVLAAHWFEKGEFDKAQAS